MTATPQLLTAAQVEAALAALPGWSRVGDELRAGWGFASFAQAVAFTVSLAALAERRQHHPEWRVAYRRVELSVTTHEVGGLTVRDLDLAREVLTLIGSAAGIDHDS